MLHEEHEPLAFRRQENVPKQTKTMDGLVRHRAQFPSTNMPDAAVPADAIFQDMGGRDGHRQSALAEEDQTVVEAETLAGADADVPGSGGVDAQAAEAFIEGKRIGDRIKHLRQRKQMGLVELGRHTGLSASFLSQLETGRVVPTLRNLARIAMVFSKDMSYFFEPERPELFRILRAEERHRLPQSGVPDPGYYFESLGHVPLDGGIAPYVAEFLPSTDQRQPRAHSHAGAEFLYVLAGCMRLTHEGQAENLAEDDAVFFHASTTHSYERVGDEACEALIITLQEPPRGHHTGSRIPLRNGKSGGANGARRRR